MRFLILAITSICLWGCQANVKSPDKGDSLTTILVKEKSFNFGEIKQKDSVVHKFVVKNTGNIPLIIKSAKASCGCTIPEFTNKPILPNEETQIKVKFKPLDVGAVNKSIVVQANIDSLFYVFLHQRQCS